MLSLVELPQEELEDMELPFKIDLLPTSYPNPKGLIMNIEQKKNANNSA